MKMKQRRRQAQALFTSDVAMDWVLKVKLSLTVSRLPKGHWQLRDHTLSYHPATHKRFRLEPDAMRQLNTFFLSHVTPRG